LLDWRERKADGPTRKKNERIIVFRNVFDPKEFDVSEVGAKVIIAYFKVCVCFRRIQHLLLISKVT